MLGAWGRQINDKNATPDDIVQVYKDTLTKRISLSWDGFLARLEKKLPRFPRRKAEMAALDMASDLKEFVFEDVWPFLDQVRDYDLNVLTSGEKTLQEMRLKASGLEKYFNCIICTGGPKEEFFKGQDCRREKFIMIDDNPHTVDAIEQTVPEVVTVLVNRPDNILPELKSKYRDFEVGDFKELTRLFPRIH
jgi:FMN phosphatase YigB (HAD superfamily)